MLFDYFVVTQFVLIVPVMWLDYREAEWAHESPLRAYGAAYLSLGYRIQRRVTHLVRGVVVRRVERKARVAADQVGPGATTRPLRAVRDRDAA
jgi:hypothetical protein